VGIAARRGLLTCYTVELVALAVWTGGLVVIDFRFEGWNDLHPHGGRLDRFVTPRLIASATD